MKHSTLFLAGSAVAIAIVGPAVMSSAADRLPVRSIPAAPVPDNVPIAFLMDLSSGQILYSRNPDTRFVPASVTKVMTAYTAFKLIGEGHISPVTQLVVSQELADKWSGEGSSMFLQARDRVTIGQLLLGVTTVSGNDAAVMLAQSATGSLDNWLKMMNANAAALGMRNTHFGTPNGWMDEGHTYTSARDLAMLADALTQSYPELYHRYFGHHRMTYNNIQQVNHDPVTGIVEGADGIKTGYTRQAGYNVLGSAQRGGRRLVVVIAGAPTPNDRNRTVRELLEWGFQAFTSRELLAGGIEVGSARVQGGSAMSVPLRTAAPVMASQAPGEVIQQPSLEVRYSGPLTAPIRKDQPVATLRVTVPGQQPHDVPLLSEVSVGPANFFQRLRNGIFGVLS
ncbi:MAG: D-alanyl-D-alanine carboxypeptidase family protein [Croceibacterium sp.]